MNSNQIQVGEPYTGSSVTIGDMKTYGWCCPKCGRVYSPSTTMCLYCGGNTNVMPNNVNDDMPSLKDYLVYKVNPLEAPEVH